MRPAPTRAESLATPLVALAIVLTVVAALLVAGAGPGARLGLWHWSSGFGVLRWGVYLAIAALVAGALGALVAARARRGRLLLAAAAVLMVSGAAFGIPRYRLSVARTVPKIHDVTTDFERPPEFRALLVLRSQAQAKHPPEYDGPAVAEQQRAYYTDLRPARFREEPRPVFAAAERVARGLGWQVIAANMAEGRLEATDTTFWFGFTDDVAVRVEAEDGGGTRVDVRSKSRVGGSDAGANAARVRRFLAGLHGEGLTPLR